MTKSKDEQLSYIPSGMDIVKIALLQRYNELDSIFSNYTTHLSAGTHDSGLELTLIETIKDIYSKMYRSYPDIDKIKNFEKINKIFEDSFDGNRKFTYSQLINFYMFLQEVGRKCGLFKISFEKKDWSNRSAVKETQYEDN